MFLSELKEPSLCDFILPPSERGTLQQNPPRVGFSQSHRQYSLTSAFNEGRLDIGCCSWVTAQQAAARPRQWSAHGFPPDSWGWGCGSVPPNYLSVMRSPGNRDQACWIGRHFKHQKGGQTSRSGGPGAGVAEKGLLKHQVAEASSLHYVNVLHPLIESTIRNRRWQELRKTHF